MPGKQLTVHIVNFKYSNTAELDEALAMDNYNVICYEAAQANFTLAAGEHPHLIILNITADQSGSLACCRNFRTAYPECAICLIHEGISEWEESIALELGADAVITRPSEIRRTLAQVKALLRRQTNNNSPRLQIMSGSRTVKVNNRSINLTDAEFELLSVLANEQGTVVSRDTISQHLRGLAYDYRNRTIDLRIARIRHKLGDNALQPLFIKTVRGEGYMLIASDG